MKPFIWSVLFMSLLLTACSSSQVKTKWTDKNMRIMIDPESIDVANYVEIQTALVKSGKFMVIGRGTAMKAVKREQEMLHRTEGDRFEDKEKWAHWGKLYGVGAIVIAHIQCIHETTWYQTQEQTCRQFLNMIDANTGEVFLAVDGEASIDSESNVTQLAYNYVAPSWQKIVKKLVEEYPKNFTSDHYRGPALQYQEISAEQAQRQKEEQGK